MSDLVAFNDDDAEAILEATDRELGKPALPGPPSPRPPRPTALVPWFALVTSDVEESEGFPAELQLHDPETDTWTTIEDCWLRDANGSTPEDDKRYDCLLTGVLAADGKPVVVTACC